MNYLRVIDGIIDDIFKDGLNGNIAAASSTMSTYHELNEYRGYITVGHKDRLMAWIMDYNGDNNNYYYLIDVLPNLTVDDLNMIIFKTFDRDGVDGSFSNYTLLNDSIKSSYPQYSEKVDYSSYFVQNKSSIIEYLNKYLSSILIIFFVKMCPNFALDELNELIKMAYLANTDNMYEKSYRMAEIISSHYPQYINDLDYQFLLNDTIFDFNYFGARAMSYMLRSWVLLDNGMSKRAVDMMIKNNAISTFIEMNLDIDVINTYSLPPEYGLGIVI